MKYEIFKIKTFDLAETGLFYLVYLLIFGLSSFTVNAQFTSGSTGADGAFNPPNGITVVNLPESGILNYTTINIGNNSIVRFNRNSRNTPVVILATGDINISGRIEIKGESGNTLSGGAGGPGGFRGGDAGIASTTQTSPGKNGEGPGGGIGGGANTRIGYGGGGGFSATGGTSTAGNTSTPPFINGLGGPSYGLATLMPIIGGSGGGGGSSNGSSGGGSGGGGGGAILIASSTRISFVNATGNVQIDASGGTPSSGATGAGGGSGGAVRLISNTVTGILLFSVDGGAGGSENNGAGGYLRIEAYDIAGLTLNNRGIRGIVSRSRPKPVFSANPPVLRITSIGGLTPPAQPKGTFQEDPDVIIPTNQTNPVTVSIQASEIPLGTLITVNLTPENGNRISVQSTPLAGTIATSTATATVSIPDGISIISASATFELQSSNGKAIFINGEKVDRIEMTATFGGKTEVSYILKSGKKIIVNQ